MFTGVLKTRHHSLSDHGSFQLSHGSNNGEHDFSHRRASVEHFPVAGELNSEGAELLKRHYQLLSHCGRIDQTATPQPHRTTHVARLASKLMSGSTCASGFWRYAEVSQISSCLSLSIERKLQLACHTHFPCADDFEIIAEPSVAFQNLEAKFGEPILFLEQNLGFGWLYVLDNMVARDGIGPPTPVFSGPPTEMAKWFEIN